jgi:deferrochelatase/peroxidase EfeB
MHVLLMVFAATDAVLADYWGRLEPVVRDHGMSVLAELDGYLTPNGRNPFGFNDGIAQPHIAGNHPDAGVWMLHNSRRHNIRHVVMVPVYLVTIVLGPVGVLLYLVVRTGKTLNWFADNGGDKSGGWPSQIP